MREQAPLRAPDWAAPMQRLDRLRDVDATSATVVDRLLTVAARGLRDFQQSDGSIAFTRRFSADGEAGPAIGRSLRYAAIVVLGARHLDPETQRSVLAGRTVTELCTQLVDGLTTTVSLGDAALAVWATAASGHEGLERSLGRLDELDAVAGPRFIVDLAWVISGLVEARHAIDVEERLWRTRTRLMDSLVGTRQLFGHATETALSQRHRAHVGCFADQVYPIQALARLHSSADDRQALAVADRCAEQICALQGSSGQWWWHYDARSGDVIEQYPVYSVHQHAMAPMALLDLEEAGGRSELGAIARGLTWLVESPEVHQSLVLDDARLTVRKVARSDPAKLVRGLRAVTTAAKAGMRLEILDRLYPPGTLDRECRPYEFGWLLDCWLGGINPAVDRAGAHNSLEARK